MSQHYYKSYHQRFKTPDQRFDEKYEISEDGCWNWKNGRDDEYPRFYMKPKPVKASHYSWERANGRKLNRGEQVLHKCDNPRCVNPDHLFVGDVSANMLDRSRKGRFDISGSKNGRARITRHMADLIFTDRRKGMSQQALADKYGVGQTTISALLRGDHWLTR